MQCFARWKEDKDAGVCFRDETILQFGDGWELLASFVLLNPGSAVPLDLESQGSFLAATGLPLAESRDGDKPYLRFSVDPLMRNLMGLYAACNSGGVLRIYNLFNLKNAESGSAIEQFKAHRHHSDMFTPDEDVRYSDRPVVIACGDNAFADDALIRQLRRYIARANPGQLFSLKKTDERRFSIVKAEPDDNGLVTSYHPSYTFKYGNRTELA